MEEEDMEVEVDVVREVVELIVLIVRWWDTLKLISLPRCQVMEGEDMEVEVDVVREVVELSVLIVRWWDTLKKCVIPCMVSQCIQVSKIEHKLFEEVYIWLKSNCKAQPSLERPTFLNLLIVKVHI